MNEYIPPEAIKISDSPQTFRFAIQGPPGTGKTSAALTFPNPLIINFDKTDIQGLIKSSPYLKDIVAPLEIPFWDDNFILKVLKEPLRKSGLVNTRDAFISWLRARAKEFTLTQSIILDSWTSMQNAFDVITFHELEKIYDKKGEEKYWAPWEAKIAYSLEVCKLLESCKCNVIVLFHEIKERDKITGNLLDKLQPLMQGKFLTELKQHFPYFVRQIVREDTNKNPEFLWQIKSNNEVDIKFIGKPDRPTHIPAKYSSLICGENK